MLLLTLLLDLLALAWVFVLPGWFISHAAGRSWPSTMRLGAGFTIGVLVVPLVSFSAAWVLGTNVRTPLVLAVATSINLLGLLGWWLRRRNGSVTST